jgi:hypothetical protein
MSIERDSRAQHVLSRTKTGQEGQVACDELDAGVGKALIELAGASQAESLERLSVAYRLAERERDAGPALTRTRRA